MQQDFFSPVAPRLGFGLMRLPMKDGKIDIETVCAMTDAFLEAGFDYFDTAYVYEGSEEAARAALTSRYPRSRYHIASKLPGTRPGILTKKEDNRRTFFESLERLNIDYFDCYLLHNASRGRIKLYDLLESWDFCLRMKQEGFIRRLGFSFHDSPETLERLLCEHPEVDFVQLQINFIDWDDPFIQARRQYEVARAHKKPVVIMEPVKGGMLANLREEQLAPLRALDANATPASWALRFCASLEGVPVVLSGMSAPEQMAENVQTMRDARPLTGAERETLLGLTRELRRQAGMACTGCHYCVKGCPQGIPISDFIDAHNNYRAFGKTEGLVRHYNFLRMAGASPASCLGCGQCEGVCPQRLPIMKALRELSQAMEG